MSRFLRRYRAVHYGLLGAAVYLLGLTVYVVVH